MSKRHARDLPVALVGGLLTLLAGAHAAAQVLATLFPEGVPGYDRAPGVTVQSRLHPEQQPQGMRLGSFRMQPIWEESFGYDTNVMGNAQSKGSWTISTRPSVLLNSDWSDHAFGAYVSLSNTTFANVPSQNRTDGSVFVGGAIDIGRDRLTMGASYIATHQDRTQLGALPSDRPIPVQIEDVRVSYDIRSGPWTWTPNIQFAHWSYGAASIQGLPAPQSYRDRNVFQGGVTVRYELAPLRNLVFVTRGIGQRYTQPTPGQPSSNSTGMLAMFGFDYDDASVWRYRLLLGVETRQFASSAYQAHTGVVAEGEVTWTPSGLTTVRGTVFRGFEDAAQEGVSGYVYTAGRLSVDHELFRDIRLSAAAGIQQISYFQGGSQWGYSLGGGVTWVLNRNVRVSATYDFSSVQGQPNGIGPVGGDYGRSVGLLTVRLAL